MGRNWRNRAEFLQGREAIEAFLLLCPDPLPITAELHGAAREIAEKHSYGIYDGLVIAAALDAGCSVLYSEDLQDGQRVGGQLTIRNPFAMQRVAHR